MPRSTTLPQASGLAPGLRQARELHTATLLSNGKVLVAGGVNGSAMNTLASAEVFNPNTSTWSGTGSMNYPRYYFTSTLLANGKVLAAGYGSTAELFNPASGSWTMTDSMTDYRSSHTATLLADGRVLVVGGHSPSSPYTMAKRRNLRLHHRIFGRQAVPYCKLVTHTRPHCFPLACSLVVGVITGNGSVHSRVPGSESH